MAAFPARDRDDFMAHWTVPRSLPLVWYGDNLDPSFGHAKHNEERKALHYITLGSAQISMPSKWIACNCLTRSFKFILETRCQLDRHFPVPIMCGKNFSTCIWVKLERTFINCDVHALRSLPRPRASNGARHGRLPERGVRFRWPMLGPLKGQGLGQGFEAAIPPDSLVPSLVMSTLPSIALGFECSCVKYRFCSGPGTQDDQD